MDRRLRGPPAGVAWIAADPERAWIRLAWTVELELGALVIHGLGAHGAAERAEARLERGGRVVETRGLGIVSSDPGGTRCQFPFTRADAVTIRIERVPAGAATGAPARASTARATRGALGIAEIEALARLP